MRLFFEKIALKDSWWAGWAEKERGTLWSLKNYQFTTESRKFHRISRQYWYPLIQIYYFQKMILKYWSLQNLQISRVIPWKKSFFAGDFEFPNFHLVVFVVFVVFLWISWFLQNIGFCSLLKGCCFQNSISWFLWFLWFHCEKKRAATFPNNLLPGLWKCLENSKRQNLSHHLTSWALKTSTHGIVWCEYL